MWEKLTPSFKICEKCLICEDFPTLKDSLITKKITVVIAYVNLISWENQIQYQTNGLKKNV